jgi:hypothetical protein
VTTHKTPGAGPAGRGFPGHAAQPPRGDEGPAAEAAAAGPQLRAVPMGFEQPKGVTEIPEWAFEDEPPACTCYTAPPHAVNCKYRFWLALRGEL